MNTAKDRTSANDAQNQELLFHTIIENIKQPLLHIARQAELTQITEEFKAGLSAIELTADSTLKLLDNYILSLRLAQAQVNLEPVSVSAVLDSSAHQLSQLARQLNCNLEIHLAGKYGPVMAHRLGLEAALTSLGCVFIESQSGLTRLDKPTLKLGAHRSRSGIVTGLFSNLDGFSATLYKNNHKVSKQSRGQVMPLTAGVMVANSLLTSMSVNLKMARHQKLTGLAATFLPSHQMVLVK